MIDGVMLGCFATVMLITGTLFSTTAALKTSSIGIQSMCQNIDLQPDQCSFVQANCHGFDDFYLELYYCSTLWKPISVVLLVSCLFMLFGAISVVASDFFCPNLQIIASKLKLSESMAGVTILAMGNGSPDLFSTFSAMNSDSGSLAIGELIGAAFFIVAIVSGCMSIIQPFKSQKITFTRDATFLTGAIMIITWIVYHQKICWYHSLILIGYYLSYVGTVLYTSYTTTTPAPLNSPPAIIEHKVTSTTTKQTSQEDHHRMVPDESTHLLKHHHDNKTKKPKSNGNNKKPQPPKLSIPSAGFSFKSNLSEASSQHHHLGRVICPVSPSHYFTPRNSTYFDIPRSASTAGSVSVKSHHTRPMTPRVGIRTSLFGAIEFQQQIKNLSRDSSTKSIVGTPIIKRQRQASMPPPAWRNLQQASPNHDDERYRPRSSTISNQTLSAKTSNAQQQQQQQHQQDYFTYLSIPTPNQLKVPEIRVAPSSDPSGVLQEEQRSPERSASAISLGPPSSRLNSEQNLFKSARQSFEISPSNSTNSLWPPPSLSHPSLQQPITTPNQQEEIKKEASLLHLLFPTLLDWHEKTGFSKLSSVVAAPLVFVFTITLPVADIMYDVYNDMKEREEDLIVIVEEENNHDVEEDDPEMADLASEELTVIEQDIKQSWSQPLFVIQSFISTIFIFSVLIENGMLPRWAYTIGFVSATLIAIASRYKTCRDKPPTWFWMISFVGFFVSLNWIFLLANQVVGLLQALGILFGISDAIMGLTVFALGNSIGDFVANTAIAKMGFPTMAISACYAGPLLNMVLGVGISSFYQTWQKSEPYLLEIAPTIMVSSIGLIVVLSSTLVVVNLNNYHMTKKLGLWMVAVYLACLFINLVLEFFFL